MANNYGKSALRRQSFDRSPIGQSDNWKVASAFRLATACFSAALITIHSPAIAQTVDPYYASNYNVRNVGEVPDLPGRYGGLTLKVDDSNTLLIGGDADSAIAKIYRVTLVRGTNGHITGLSGSATYFADAHGLPDTGGGIDGGLIYGPGNVLFYSSFPDGSIGQIKFVQTTVAKQTDLATLGVSGSPGSLVIVPAGLPGAGRLKILSYDSSRWYDTTLSPDGSGTYNIAPVSGFVTFTGNLAPEGAFYVAAGSPKFTNHSVLVADYGNDKIVSFQVDANGDPILNTQRNFITGVSSVEGAAADPLTGDFLFSSFNGKTVFVVGGFGATAPIVTITAPQNNAVFPHPGSFTIEADASQPGGTITEVRFYVDGILVDMDNESSYTGSAIGLAPGLHGLTAVAIGNGLITTSSVVNITVINATPSVAITAPGDNSVIGECGEVSLKAMATDVDGIVTSVAYYLNTLQLLETRTSPPYLFVTTLPVGSNSLTAVATDNLGARSTSAVVRVIVERIPTNTMSANLLASGQLILCFRGVLNASYVFEQTFDISDSPAWTPFATNTASAGQSGLINTSMPIQPSTRAKFFRMRRQ